MNKYLELRFAFLAEWSSEREFDRQIVVRAFVEEIERKIG